MSTSRAPSTSGLKSDAREYFWGCTLNAENPVVEWSFKEEEDDTDFMSHTLFLRHAVFGAEAKDGETNVVEIETEMFEGRKIKQPILSLVPGKNNMTLLDLSFDHFCPVKFRLIGSGPIHLSGQQVVDFPSDDMLGESSMEDTMDVITEDDEDEEEALLVEGKVGKKRKANAASEPKSKRGKVEKNGDHDEDEESMDEEDEDEEDEAEDESEEDSEEDQDESPEKPKKKGKGKPNGKQATNGSAKKGKATKKATKSPSPKKSKKSKSK